VQRSKAVNPKREHEELSTKRREKSRFTGFTAVDKTPNVRMKNRGARCIMMAYLDAGYPKIHIKHRDGRFPGQKKHECLKLFF
jgi:hypothetical protein